jgi:hypothetical protein
MHTQAQMGPCACISYAAALNLHRLKDSSQGGREDNPRGCAHATEMRSPFPPSELSFAHGGALELKALMALLRWAGAAAPSLARTHAAVVPRGLACDASAGVDLFHVGLKPLCRLADKC